MESTKLENLSKGMATTVNQSDSRFWGVNPESAENYQKLGQQVENKVDDSSDITTINTNDAINDLNKDKEKLDLLDQFVGTKQEKVDGGTLYSDETGQQRFVQDKPKEEEKSNNLTFADAYELFGDDFTGLKRNADGTFTPDASAYERIGIKGIVDETDGGLEGDLKELDDTITTLTNNFLNYNVENDPDYQAEVENITQQYSKMRNEMSNINTSRKRALETLGYRTGSTQYAGAIQLGIVGEEIKQGDERIAEITRQESAAKSAAKKAFKDGKYSEFAQKMDALDTLRDNKLEELKIYNEKLAEANKLIQEQAKQEFEITKWLTEQDWKEKELNFEYTKFIQSTEEFNAKFGLDVESLGFDKAKFNQEYNLGLAKFQEDIRQFGESSALDKLKLEIEQSDSIFDKQIKFQTLLNTIPEGQEINIEGMTGVGRKSDDLTVEQQLKLDKDGYYIDENGIVKQKPVDKATLDAAQKEVDDALTVLKHPGLNESVGPNPLARGALNWNEFINSNAGNFVAKVEQIISQKALSSLIAAKARGATFGALSDTEMAILTKSATELGSLRKYRDNDPTKEVIGYKTTESNFKRIIEEIQNSAQKILDYAEQERAEMGGQQISPTKVLDDYYKENPNMRQHIDSLEGEGLSDEEKLKVLGISFNQVGSDTNQATLKKVAKIEEGKKEGQCGRFVNKITGLGLGDSYQSKLAKMDTSIKAPQSGMVFVMPYKDTGHTGIILSVDNGLATVKDSNWSLDEKVKIHKIPVSKMTGFANV
jgi:hypothetical protein